MPILQHLVTNGFLRIKFNLDVLASFGLDSAKAPKSYQKKQGDTRLMHCSPTPGSERARSRPDGAPSTVVVGALIETLILDRLTYVALFNLEVTSMGSVAVQNQRRGIFPHILRSASRMEFQCTSTEETPSE
jgi:hypothetical protein